MKKIIVSRKNEYMSGGQTFSFYVNQKKYLIDTNSSITVENWSEVNKVMGSHVTVSFGSEINCAISGTGLVKK